MTRIRTLLADDHEAVLDNLKSLLLDGRFEIIGTVLNGADLIEASGRLHPDLVILDISMPVVNGIDAAARIRQSGSTAKIVFLTVHEDQDFVDAAFEAGAQAYVVKRRFATDLAVAIEKVLEGSTFVSPSRP